MSEITICTISHRVYTQFDDKCGETKISEKRVQHVLNQDLFDVLGVTKFAIAKAKQQTPKSTAERTLRHAQWARARCERTRDQLCVELLAAGRTQSKI